jgi:adenylosuccinate synthase
MHLVPAGIIHKNVTNLIGNGVVVEPAALVKEMESLSERGIDFTDRFFISSRAHVIMPYHTAFDKLNEERAGDRKIGTTGRGIGPCYADKASRTGIRMGDLLNPKHLITIVEDCLTNVNPIAQALYGIAPFKPRDVTDNLLSQSEKLLPYITETSLIANEALKAGKKILLEGAQGTLLDIDLGTYPFVTSSNGTAGGACTGSGIPPRKIDAVVGVMKAYSTRVGSGPFPTELTDEAGELLRNKGGEYGATTGRPRRCGYIDMVALKYSCMVNGITHLAVTKLDVLSELDEIKVCEAYRINGKDITDFPADICALENAAPVYKIFKGWKKDLSGCRKYAELPEETKGYLTFIKEDLEVTFSHISVGTDRSAVIEYSDLF